MSLKLKVFLYTFFIVLVDLALYQLKENFKSTEEFVSELEHDFMTDNEKENYPVDSMDWQSFYEEDETYYPEQRETSICSKQNCEQSWQKNEDDYLEQSFNDHQYKVNYLMEPKLSFEGKCDKKCSIKGGQSYTMVTFIKSKATNTKIRNFLRRTWTSVKYTRNGILLYVFVVGRPTSEETFNLIEEESKQYEDILMFDGPDDYRNIARKTLSAMQWASENLPSSYLYSSGDDDMMIDVATLDDVIMKTTTTTSRLPYFPFICVHGIVANGVQRSGKYAVPRHEYPGRYWPRGCNGGFYTTRVDTITKVWRQADKETIVRMDDVWITAVLRKNSGIPDECVVAPYFRADLHTWQYAGKGDPGSEGFMKSEWREFSEEIKRRPHCRCSKIKV